MTEKPRDPSDSAATFTRDNLPAFKQRFLNEHPLYTVASFSFDEFENAFEIGIFPEKIRRPCSSCEVDTNWSRESSSAVTNFGTLKEGTTSWNSSVISYVCLQCEKMRDKFWILFRIKNMRMREVSPNRSLPFAADFELQKLGQNPAQSIRPDSKLLKRFTEHEKDLYRKALTSMANGYGIGALSYLRCVVDSQTSALIDVLIAAAESDGDADGAEKLRATKTSKSAEEKLQRASELVPSHLRSLGGGNVLKVLYGAFSTGIHGGDDDACMAEAKRLRIAFEFVFKSIAERLEELRQVKAALEGR